MKCETNNSSSDGILDDFRIKLSISCVSVTLMLTDNIHTYSWRHSCRPCKQWKHSYNSYIIQYPNTIYSNYKH